MNSSDGELFFKGYGDKESLRRDQIDDAINRIYSNHGLNFIVSAPGRLFLFGEHSVNYGKSAILATINKRTFIKFTENKINNILAIFMRNIDLSFHISYDKIIELVGLDIPSYESSQSPLKYPISDPDCIDHGKFLKIIRDYFVYTIGPLGINQEQLISLCTCFYLLHGIFYKWNIFNRDKSSFFPFVLDISSGMLIGSGLGSSASFCVSLAAAFIFYKNIKIHGLNSAKEITFSAEGLELISKWASNAERIIHGIPSIIDSLVVVNGSFIKVDSGQFRKFTKFDIGHTKILAKLIESGVKRNTISLFNLVSRRYYSNQELLEQLFMAINHVCQQAISILSTFNSTSELLDLNALQEVVSINQGLLYSLGVSHDRVQEICKICNENGLSAKTTGAGGGGCVFTFLPHDYAIDDKFSNCFDRLTGMGFNVSDVELGVEDGVRLDSFIHR